MTGDDQGSEIPKPQSDRLEAKILELCAARGPEKSICPSEVARALEPADETWRGLMKPVRRAAVTLAENGRIDILKKGKRIDPASVKGVIRLRLAQDAQ